MRTAGRARLAVVLAAPRCAEDVRAEIERERADWAALAEREEAAALVDVLAEAESRVLPQPDAAAAA